MGNIAQKGIRKKDAQEREAAPRRKHHDQREHHGAFRRIETVRHGHIQGKNLGNGTALGECFPRYLRIGIAAFNDGQEELTARSFFRILHKSFQKIISLFHLTSASYIAVEMRFY